MINFRVLGTTELRTADGRDLHALLAQPKRVALLAYLCVARPRGFHRRDTLLGLFWPDADDAHARTSLRKAIHVLRHSLGDEAISSRGDEEIAVVEERINCDAARFDDMLAAGQLEAAMDLYRGDLLEGLFLDDVPTFERWLETERARMRDEAARLAHKLAERFEHARDYTGAVTMARRAVVLADTDERMLRRLLELLDRLGDRAGAIQTYDEFVRRLAAEFETQPSAETQQLAVRLREHSEPRANLVSAPAPLVPGSAPIATATDVGASLAETDPCELTLMSPPRISGYHIERELGRGGMAIVYLAHDAKHDRKVAIKVLRQEVAATLGTERFLAEIRTTARLTHPHVVPLIDSGSVNGVPYYVMPYVAGETLRGLLERAGPLPVGDVVHLACEVAGALGYAHAQGIVHQDIKPENILIASGQAMVADFGVSRAIATAMSPPAEESSTQRTLVLGSPAYMSPEQALGERLVDGRSDVYALGCVVQYMLAGEPPFTGESASAILSRKLAEDATLLGTVRSGLPRGIERAVARAMRRTPADRFASAEDFASALTRAARDYTEGRLTSVSDHRARSAGVLAVGALALAAVVWRAQSTTAPAEIRSIALLPIVADSAGRPLADEIHERLIDDLAHVSALRVTGPASSARYRESNRPLGTIARELDVDVLVEGTLTLLRGDSISLDLRLRGGRASVAPWAREFVTDVGHLERFRKQVARTVLESLRLPLTSDERRWLARYRVSDPRAAEAYARGRLIANSFDPKRFEKSIAAFQEAIRIDPDDPAPYVALAETYQTMVGATHVEQPPAEVLGLSKAAIDRALALDPDDADAHVVRAGLLYMFDWKWVEADREFRHAIAINPGSGKAHWQYGGYLRFNGWPDSAIAEHRRAVRIDPLNPMFLGELSLAHAWAGHGDSAVRWGRAAVELDPNLAPVRYALSHAFLAAQQFDSAIAEGKIATQLNSQFVGRLAEVYVAAGRRVELEQLLVSMPKPIWDWFWLILAARKGDRETALRYLELLADRHQIGLGAVRGDPAYAPLAIEPRYQKVLARMGLPPRAVAPDRVRRDSR
ncbi:MAG: protein kinase [Gemmatimonadota bacterium]